MPPKPAAKGKGKVVDVQSIVGAKFAWVTAGQLSNPIKIIVNLNCPVDILLDFIRREMLARVEALIVSTKERISLETPHPEGPTGDRGGTPNHDNSDIQTLFTKLSELQSTLSGEGVALDLNDPTGVCANCSEVSIYLLYVSNNRVIFLELRI